jgi:hypothetical protein
MGKGPEVDFSAVATKSKVKVRLQLNLTRYALGIATLIAAGLFLRGDAAAYDKCAAAHGLVPSLHCPTPSAGIGK